MYTNKINISLIYKYNITKKLIKNILFRVFPPGTIYSVYTDEGSVFCGGHFLTPQVMDRFVKVLGQKTEEIDRRRRTARTARTTTCHNTNDFLNEEGGLILDFFRILGNFILDTLRPANKGNLTKHQLRQFISQFEKYLLGLKQPFLPVEDDDEDQHHDEQDHFLVRGRLQFEKKAKKEKWVKKLKEKYTEMAW